MSQYYFAKLKQAIADGRATEESFRDIVEETRQFLGVIRVRLESADPEMQKQAARELSELKQLLLQHTLKTA